MLRSSSTRAHTKRILASHQDTWRDKETHSCRDALPRQALLLQGGAHQCSMCIAGQCRGALLRQGRACHRSMAFSTSMASQLHMSSIVAHHTPQWIVCPHCKVFTRCPVAASIDDSTNIVRRRLLLSARSKLWGCHCHKAALLERLRWRGLQQVKTRSHRSPSSRSKAPLRPFPKRWIIL